MKKILDHRGKRVSYEWADKRRERRKRDLLWEWVQYIEAGRCKQEHIPETWEQVELRKERNIHGLLKRAMKDE